jgi:hypothetical protein
MSDPTPTLLSRVEALSGGDWEVEALILRATGHVSRQNVPDPGDAWPDYNWYWFYPDGSRGEHFGNTPPVTTSLDATLALVERVLRPLHPGMTLTLKAIYSGSRGPYWYAEITWPSSERQGRAHTAPLALLAALLRAVEAGT